MMGEAPFVGAPNAFGTSASAPKRTASRSGSGSESEVGGGYFVAQERGHNTAERTDRTASSLRKTGNDVSVVEATDAAEAL